MQYARIHLCMQNMTIAAYGPHMGIPLLISDSSSTTSLHDIGLNISDFTL